MYAPRHVNREKDGGQCKAWRASIGDGRGFARLEKCGRQTLRHAVFTGTQSAAGRNDSDDLVTRSEERDWDSEDRTYCVSLELGLRS